MSRETFLNFPIQLLQRAPDMKKMGDDIMDYAIYKHSKSLNGGLDERVKSAAKYFGITLGSIKGSIENGQLLHESIHPRSPMTGINKDLLFDFYQGNQPVDDIVALLAHLAIKSILGQKSFCRITTDFLLCRMAGYPNMDEVHELPEFLAPYATRRRMNRIKSDLRESYGLKIYARYTRGFFVSFSLSLEDLIRQVEMKRQKWSHQHQQAEISNAVTKVLNELYNGKDESITRG